MINFTGIGAVIDWSMSGHIIEQYGWKYAFYVVAVIFGIFTILLLIFVYDSPSTHPRITGNERDLILSKLNVTVSNKKVILSVLSKQLDLTDQSHKALASISINFNINSILGAAVLSLRRHVWFLFTFNVRPEVLERGNLKNPICM